MADAGRSWLDKHDKAFRVVVASLICALQVVIAIVAILIYLRS